MSRLGVWSIATQDAEEGLGQPEPRAVARSDIGLERHLEDWIARDVTLISEGLTLVGRQVSIHDGRLDLLAIDVQDRWVVIEVKPGELDSGALAQALYYASSIASLGSKELLDKLEHRLGDFGDPERLSTKVRRQLDGEGEKREIAVLLVGAGIHPGLERVSDFLGGFRVPISVVSFEVFELEGGPKLLIREVVEESIQPSGPGPRYTVEAIREMAVEQGVVAQFNRFERMSKDAGLAVQPQGASIRIAPPADRRRFLMYASPHSRGMTVYTGPGEFAEFFPVTGEEAAQALGRDSEDGFLAGTALEERLDRIERFLTERIRPHGGAG